MIAKAEWFATKRGFTGKVHFIPTKKEGWFYYLGVFAAFFLSGFIHYTLTFAVMIFMVVDLIQVAIKQSKQ